MRENYQADGIAQTSSGALLRAALLFLSVGLASPGLMANSQQSLSDVQQQIRRQQVSIDDHQSELTRLTEEAKRQDKKLARVVLYHQQIQEQLKQSKRQSRDLDNSITDLQQSIASQKEVLGQQMQSAYMEGRLDYLKLLLSQDTPSSIERNLSYYEYLVNGRVELIQKLSSDQEKLAQRQIEHNQLQQQLVKLDAEHRDQSQLLGKQLKQTETAQRQLRKWLSEEKQQLAHLQKSETQLTRQLERARAQAKARALQLANQAHITEQKGKLPWPIKGQKLHNYGDQRNGHLTWNGWLIKARQGQEVKAVAPGKVIYSDWLNGLGMVIVLDHGQNYLSLYGHNQALLHETGSEIAAGDVVALSGNSGTESTPGVYFELRHKGQTQDPRYWLR